MNHLKSLTVVTALFIAGTAQASIPEAQASIIPIQLQKLFEQKSAQLIERFDYQEFNGWVVQDPNGDTHLYWSTGDYLIPGPLIDQDGRNMTSIFLEKKKPKVDLSEGHEYLVHDTLQLSPTPQNPAALYVFVEPACDWCKKLQQRLKPFMDSGLAVAWVPVNFMRPSGMNIIQSWLDAENPHRAYMKHASEETPAAAQLSDDLSEKLDRNHNILRMLGGKGTPFMVYSNGRDVNTSPYLKDDKALAKFVIAAMASQQP